MNSQEERRLWEQLPTLTSIFHFRDFEYFGEQAGKDRSREFWSSADLLAAAVCELGRLGELK